MSSNPPSPLLVYDLPRDILVHGIYSTRKTTTAMTASKDYPTDKAPIFKPPVALSDIAVIAWDNQPTLTLPHLGMVLPKEHVFETHGRCTFSPDGALIPEPINTTCIESRKWAVALAKKGVKFFVHDTGSTKDSRIVTWWTELIDEGQKLKTKVDKNLSTVLYRNVLSLHTQELVYWQNFANHFGTYNIWNFHSAIKGGDAMSTDPSALKAKDLERLAKGLTGAELGARLTGQAWNFFYENMRMVFYQTLEESFSTKKAVWYTRSKDYAVKPCFPEGVLPDKLDADFRTLFKIARGEKVSFL